MKKLLGLILLLILALPLAGCYDYSEPDEKAWVLAIGMDKGKENILTVTMIIAVPKNIGGASGGEPSAGGGGNETFLAVSMEVNTLLGGLELLDAMVDRRPDLAHIKWFVFSRELAEAGIEQYLTPLARFYQFRRSSNMIICEGRAAEFLSQGEPKLEDNVGKYYELVQRGWRYNEFIPFDTLHQFYLKSKTPGVAAVATLAALEREEPVYQDASPKPKGKYQAGKIPRKGGSKIEVMGGAVFIKGIMVGTLNSDQMGIVKMLEGTFRRTIKDIPDPEQPDKYLIADVRPRQRPRVNVRIVDGYPQITVDLKLEGDLLSIQSGINYENPQMLYLAEQAIIQSLQEDISNTVAKSQELGADFFGFGLHAKKLFRTWPEWEAYNWDSKYSQATISVNVDYKLRRIGLLRKTVPLQ